MGFKEKIIEYSLIKEKNKQKVEENFLGLKELYNKNKFGFFMSIIVYSAICGLIVLFSLKLIRYGLKLLF